MKKHLALVLALVMALTSFSFVSAAPDFSDIEGATYENAVKRLELLDILEGYPDGTFKPNDTITRAEFATVAVRAKGLAGVAEAAAGLPSGFSDVPAWHWASGFVGTAASTGVVNGIGNGLFAPAAPVKYEEAVTMLVRALGYEPEAQVKGGYPFGYLVVAEEIGLLDDARGVQGTWATRGLVAQLTDNAMEIPMMVSIGFGDNVRWVVSGSAEHGGNEVYLLHTLGVDEIEGIVMENFHINSRLDADEIKVFDLDEEENVTLEVTESVDVNAILGLEVTAWAKDDVVFAVTVDTDSDLMAYDSIVEAETTEDVVYLYDLDDDYDWAVRDENYGDAKVYVNNVKEDVEDAKGFGRIIMNEDDEVVFAYLFDFEDFGVVTEIDDMDMEYVNVADAGIDELALDDAEEIYVLTKDFAAMSIDDVTAGMSVFFWIDSDDNYFMVAFEDMIEGELEEVRVRDTRITVDGVNYSPSADAIYSDDDMDTFNVWDTALETLVDENVLVYIDVNGEAMLLVTDEAVTTNVYGVATWFSTGRTDTLSVFTAEGEEVTYDFDDRGILNTADFGDIKTTITNPLVVGVELELNKDAEVESYAFASTPSAISKGTDTERVSIGGTSYYITEDTVIVKALNSSGELKPSLMAYDDIFDLAIASGDGFEVVFIEEEGKDLGLLAFVDADFQATDDTMYGIATNDEYRRGSDYFVEIDVAGEGKSVYTLSAREGLKKGDMVTFAINNDGEAVINSVILLSTLKSTTPGAVEVTEVLTNYFTAGMEYRVTSDTLFYKTSDTGSFDGSTSFARIDVEDMVVVLADGSDAKVVLDATAYIDYVAPTPEVETIEFDGAYDFESITYVELEGTTYPYIGTVYTDAADILAAFTAGDDVVVTFTTIRGERVVTSIE